MLLSVELLLILGLILANGFFAAAEIAIIAARRGRLEQLAKDGDKRAARALALAQDPSQFLPTVQIGVTLVSTIASAFAGDRMVTYLTIWIASFKIPVLASWESTLAFALVVVCLTFLSVLLGELVPKRLALLSATNLALWVAPVMSALATGAKPVVSAMAWSTDTVLWLLGRHGESEPTVSMEDIEGLIRAGTGEGLLEPTEQKLALEALRLGDRTARDIMQPRLEMDAVEIGTPADEVMGVVALAGYSRLPVYEGDLDHILGSIHIKDVLRCHYHNLPFDLRKMLHPVLMVPETLPADRLLVRLKDQGCHLAIVLDEFGGTQGLVTLQNIVEELVGEIRDEHHHDDEQRIVQREDKSWLIDGAVGIDEFASRLELKSKELQEPRRFSTVAGLVLAELGRIPQVGDSLVWDNLRFEVVDMDGRRIDRLIVTPLSEPST